MKRLLTTALLCASVACCFAQTTKETKAKDTTVTAKKDTTAPAAQQFYMVVTAKDIADFRDFIMNSDNFSAQGKDNFLKAFLIAHLKPVVDSADKAKK